MVGIRKNFLAKEISRSGGYHINQTDLEPLVKEYTLSGGELSGVLLGVGL